MPVPTRIIVEMIPQGNFIKVSAVCEDTGREVSIVGDPRAGNAALKALAVKKLKYVMSKQDSGQTPRRGIEV
ncbi:DUF6898 family protein [Kordiimonas aquimaris]|uniref:DUF6898 family protein n=1 Tax=Kordiimonas aquimaris TaxID=707591 RepID=UPI0021D2461D|nr:hypothetical protein [Kordiimonas aquimaris]